MAIEKQIIPLIVMDKSGKNPILIIEYNKIENEITSYSPLDGKEYTYNQYEALNLNNNKSVMIINNEKLSTYLENLL